MTHPGPRPAVLLDRLTYRYPDGRPALRGISLEIAPGETVALVGPNGAGKSTLLLHLNGLLPEDRSRSAPLHGHHHGQAGAADDAGPRSSGSVTIEGTLVTSKTAPEVRRKVGLVFQDPDDQLFSATVLDDVAFGPLNQRVPRGEARALAMECLARVDLADAADRSPHHLSFGERKRVCLAGVLACRPTVLALDEPTANLDPRARRRFLALIRDLDATKILATHDLEMALELCDRALLLDGGALIAQGPCREVLADAELLDAHGLEVPLSLQLRLAR